MIRNKKITQLFFPISNLKNKKWYSMAAWQQHNKSEVKAKKSTWFYRQCWAWVLFSQCCFFLSSFLSAFVSYLISLSFFHIFFFSSNNRVVFFKKKKNAWTGLGHETRLFTCPTRKAVGLQRADDMPNVLTRTGWSIDPTN